MRNQSTVKSPKVGQAYFASNHNLKLKDDRGKPISKGGHTIFVTSINKNKKTCNVRTITTLSGKIRSTTDEHAVEKLESGRYKAIYPAEINNLEHLSAVDMKIVKNVPLSCLRKAENDGKKITISRGKKDFLQRRLRKK